MKPDLFNLIYFTGVIHVLCESYMKLDASRQVWDDYIVPVRLPVL
jgi:hypothetical protein